MYFFKENEFAFVQNVPPHWKISKLRYFFQEMSGSPSDIKEKLTRSSCVPKNKTLKILWVP